MGVAIPPSHPNVKLDRIDFKTVPAGGIKERRKAGSVRELAYTHTSLGLAADPVNRRQRESFSI
jgi:hypothetical protein